jgi:hypothetical protein
MEQATFDTGCGTEVQLCATFDTGCGTEVQLCATIIAGCGVQPLRPPQLSPVEGATRNIRPPGSTSPLVMGFSLRGIDALMCR